MYDISIIVPIYNSKRYLKRCIESVLNQKYQKYELILINDGSTDNSGEICDCYAKSDSRIRVIHNKNVGVSASRNIGIKESKGEYILFLDSDDWLEENSLCKIYKKSIEEDLDILFFGYREVDENENVIKNNLYDNTNDRNFEDIILNISSNIKGFLFNKLIRRECIDYYFDESIYLKEDLYFLLKNRTNIKKTDFINDIVYNYRVRNNSVSHSNSKNIKHISELDVDKYICESIESKYSNEYKILFFEEYIELKYFLSKDGKKYLKENYESLQNKYYKELIESNDFEIMYKIRIFIHKHFPTLYEILKNEKRKLKRDGKRINKCNSSDI